MSINVDEDTEFNDALRKHGIISPRAPTPPSPPPPASPTLDDLLDDFTSSELQEIAEDAPDDEAEKTVAAYRQQRIAQLKKEEGRGRFGRVYPIGREDYTREVTDASAIDEAEEAGKGKGTGVVCFLYQDGIARNEIAHEHVRTLAARYPRTKFVSIIGNKCIADLPDSRTPMFIIYKNGEILNQVVAWGSDRPRKIEELEALLMVAGAIHLPEHRRPGEGRRDDDSEDEDDDVPSSRQRSSATTTNGKAPKNIRGPTKKDDSDSDFEFDM